MPAQVFDNTARILTAPDVQDGPRHAAAPHPRGGLLVLAEQPY